MISITTKYYDQVSIVDLNDKFQVSYLLIYKSINIFTLKYLCHEQQLLSEQFTDEQSADKRYKELYKKSITYKNVISFSRKNFK